MAIKKMDFRIRPIEEADFSPMKNLFCACECLTCIGRESGQPDLVSYGEAYVNETCDRGDLKSFQNLGSIFKNPRSEFWVLEDPVKGSIIGSIAIQAISPQVAELRRMCVDPTYRRRGLALRLVHHFLDYARQQGFETVFLTTPIINVGAIAMYEKAGFVRDKVDLEFRVPTLDFPPLKIARLEFKVQAPHSE